MSRWYLDTSAALKLLVEEAESEALAALVDTQQPSLAACCLLETELRRAAQRETTLTQLSVTTFLETIDLYEVPPSLFAEAGLIPGPNLRSLDALHLAGAIRIGVTHLLTYDARMADAAQRLGIPVLAPS